jgi:hypothetical protein
LNYRLFVALSLLAIVAGCAAPASHEPLRAGGSYSEEIKSPMSRQMLFDPTCAVR